MRLDRLRLLHAHAEVFDERVSALDGCRIHGTRDCDDSSRFGYVPGHHLKSARNDVGFRRSYRPSFASIFSFDFEMTDIEEDEDGCTACSWTWPMNEAVEKCATASRGDYSLLSLTSPAKGLNAANKVKREFRT